VNVREPLLDVFYAMLIRPRLGLSPNALAKIVNLLRMRECLLRNRVNLVLDVGGNVGRFVHRIRRLGYRGLVVSFEPDPHAFAQLVSAGGGIRRGRGIPSRWEMLTENRLSISPPTRS
jgi:SAM-dependent methyltransferase